MKTQLVVIYDIDINELAASNSITDFYLCIQDIIEDSAINGLTVNDWYPVVEEKGVCMEGNQARIIMTEMFKEAKET